MNDVKISEVSELGARLKVMLGGATSLPSPKPIQTSFVMRRPRTPWLTAVPACCDSVGFVGLLRVRWIGSE